MTERNDDPVDLGQYVLGLDDSVLRSVTENAYGHPVASVRAKVEEFDWPIFGCGGEKLLLKLSYSLPDGSCGEKDVYVKRQEGDPGYMETAHYQYLNGNDMPVPRFYGSHLDSGQLEVLFLEHVRPNRDGNRILKDPDTYRSFLSIAARANAMHPDGDYGKALFYFGCEKHIDRGRRTVLKLWEVASDGQLGSDLQKLCTAGNRDTVVSLGESLSRSVPTMERGYVVDDFTPVKIGWRRGTGEMLVCDLRTTGWGARFGDVGGWLGCPDWAQRAGYKRRELAEHYLAEYQAAGGNAVCLETLLEETHLLWQTGVLCGLGWWLDSHFNGHHSMEDDEWQAVCRKRLETDLTSLLRSQPGGMKG